MINESISEMFACLVQVQFLRSKVIVVLRITLLTFCPSFSLEIGMKLYFVKKTCRVSEFLPIGPDDNEIHSIRSNSRGSLFGGASSSAGSLFGNLSKGGGAG